MFEGQSWMGSTGVLISEHQQHYRQKKEVIILLNLFLVSLIWSNWFFHSFWQNTFLTAASFWCCVQWATVLNSTKSWCSCAVGAPPSLFCNKSFFKTVSGKCRKVQSRPVESKRKYSFAGMQINAIHGPMHNQNRFFLFPVANATSGDLDFRRISC